jgi:hypothetical protein
MKFQNSDYHVFEKPESFIEHDSEPISNISKWDPRRRMRGDSSTPLFLVCISLISMISFEPRSSSKTDLLFSSLVTRTFSHISTTSLLIIKFISILIDCKPTLLVLHIIITSFIDSTVYLYRVLPHLFSLPIQILR